MGGKCIMFRERKSHKGEACISRSFVDERFKALKYHYRVNAIEVKHTEWRRVAYNGCKKDKYSDPAGELSGASGSAFHASGELHDINHRTVTREEILQWYREYPIERTVHELIILEVLKKEESRKLESLHERAILEVKVLEKIYGSPHLRLLRLNNTVWEGEYSKIFSDYSQAIINHYLCCNKFLAGIKFDIFFAEFKDSALEIQNEDKFCMDAIWVFYRGNRELHTFPKWLLREIAEVEQKKKDFIDRSATSICLRHKLQLDYYQRGLLKAAINFFYFWNPLRPGMTIDDFIDVGSIILFHKYQKTIASSYYFNFFCRVRYCLSKMENAVVPKKPKHCYVIENELDRQTGDKLSSTPNNEMLPDDATTSSLQATIAPSAILFQMPSTENLLNSEDMPVLDKTHKHSPLTRKEQEARNVALSKKLFGSFTPNTPSIHASSSRGGTNSGGVLKQAAKTDLPVIRGPFGY